MTRYHVTFGRPRRDPRPKIIAWVVVIVAAYSAGRGLRFLWEWLA